MKLFLLRHGQAEDYCENDAGRKLTARGIAETESIINRKLPELSDATSIWASPYVRAQQTAEIVKRCVPDLSIDTTDLLVPDANPQRLAKALETCGVDSLILVTHQPLVGTFLDWLAGLETGRYRMGTSALALIQTEFIAGDCGELEWVVQP
ncbi:phosphohistidine phosphatase SixA [Sessilibacter corallicola]|uniref:Phosphohistidine phosphatase SixA n=1 Tax=Sessilibacter corallicola TaxID=2904075 RepID=A0ABQ0A6F5_9GAMM